MPRYNSIELVCYPVANTPNDAARFLLQSQLNATDVEIAVVSSDTFAKYLQQQFVKPIGQTGWDWLEARGYGVADSNNYFFSDYPATGMIWNQLFTSQDGMRKRVALALSEFFVASLSSAEFTWRSHAYAQYWDLLVKNAFGNFRQLLEDVTLSPAMGYYLNTKGNLKAVWTAIFLDDEARRNFLFSPSSTAPMPEPTDPGAIRNQQGVLTKAIRDLTFGKLREPMIRFIQWGRTFNLGPVSSTYEYWKIPDTSNAADALAQSPLRSPSVFNFFRPAFIPPGTVLVTKNAVAPEFQLVNETTVGGYLNFMQDVVRSGLRSYIDPAVPQASYPSNNRYKLHSAPTYFSELALVADPAALVKRINLLMAAGQISDSNQTLMINAIASMPINSTNATTLEGQRLDRVSAAILMIMASSEYLIQK